MDIRLQLELLRDTGGHPSFSCRLEESHKSPLKAEGIEVLQINLGRVCNLTCRHCHVEAGPHRREVMTRDVMTQCLDVLREHGIPAIDITGGSPEMNPYLRWFLSEAAPLKRRLMVRSNLAILHDERYRSFVDIYAEAGVEIVTSLPDYFEEKTDRQRGAGVFRKVIEIMKLLNDRGYGKDGSGLVLDLVHNPAGAYLPGSQAAMEQEYRRRLGREEGVAFNSLFCITNIPIGRYMQYLLDTDNFHDYINELCNAYNPAAVDRVMCKSTVSVGWDGTLYDCDFNQMLALPVNHGAPDSIYDFDLERLKNREIVVNNHCYGCVAGSGSSCQGATTGS